jgi:small GTP-binding protein
MLGALAVGKTALVQQYVRSIFSDSYLSSVGVKVSKKAVTVKKKDPLKKDVDEQEVNLLLWDLEGQDNYSAVNISYIKGAGGLFFVVDGTRGETLSVALMLRNTALDILGHDTPHLILVNKNDLKDTWEITDKVLASLSHSGLKIMLTSAREGFNVDLAFNTLAEMMVTKQNEQQ